jgi:predicted nucleic-acid-binding Zn-ribbon protein
MDLKRDRFIVWYCPKCDWATEPDALNTHLSCPKCLSMIKIKYVKK